MARKRLRQIEAAEETERLEAFQRQQAKGTVIYKRLDELHQSDDRTHIGEDVAKLLRYARSQTEAIRQSIIDKTDYDFTSGPTLEGDVATVLAEGVASIMRDHRCDPQTLWQAFSQAFPEVHFTVDWYNALSLVAAMFRQDQLAGIVEGLELAGVTVPRPEEG
jgi:hypothetical protein